MTADPMVPDEALEAFAAEYLLHDPEGVLDHDALRAALAAARAEVAASVLALAEDDYRGRPFVWLHEAQEAVSDDGIANHNQQMRAEAWDEGFDAASKGYDAMGMGYSMPTNPYRAEAAGDQHHQGDDE
jgi:hypothetical protein